MGSCIYQKSKAFRYAFSQALPARIDAMAARERTVGKWFSRNISVPPFDDRKWK